MPKRVKALKQKGPGRKALGTEEPREEIQAEDGSGIPAQLPRSSMAPRRALRRAGSTSSLLRLPSASAQLGRTEAVQGALASKQSHWSTVHTRPPEH